MYQRLFGLFVTVILIVFAMSACKKPLNSPTATEADIDGAASPQFWQDPTKLRKTGRKVIDNVMKWGQTHHIFIKSIIERAKEKDHFAPFAGTKPALEPGKVNLNLSNGIDQLTRNFHQYLVCNSPLRGIYVYGLIDTPALRPVADRLFPRFSDKVNIMGQSVLKRMQKGARDETFSFLMFGGVDIEYGFDAGIMVGMNLFELAVGGVELYLGYGADWSFGDDTVYQEMYVGALPFPVPYTPIVLNVEFYAMLNYDEVGLMFNYTLPKPTKLANLDADYSVGFFVTASKEKIAQLVDVDRWTGKKANDCGVGELREVPAVARNPKPSFDTVAFKTEAERKSCSSQLLQGSNFGFQKCHVAALVNNSETILNCLKNKGGRACLMANNMCGDQSGGGYQCNIENALNCLCNNGGIACFRANYQSNNLNTGDRTVCRP